MELKKFSAVAALVAGFAISFGLGLGGSMFGLVGTQGMNEVNTTRFEAFFGITAILVIVQIVAGSVGMTCVSFGQPDHMRVPLIVRGIAGFAIGALLEGPLLTFVFLYDKSLGVAVGPLYILCPFLPAISGFVAVALIPFRRPRPPGTVLH